MGTTENPQVSYKAMILICFLVQFTCWCFLQFLELKTGMRPFIRSRSPFARNMSRRNTMSHTNQANPPQFTKALGYQIQTRGSVYFIKAIWQSIGLIYCVIALATEPLCFYYLEHDINCQGIYNIYCLIISYFCWEMATNRYLKLQRSVAIHHWSLCFLALYSIYFDIFSPLITLYIIVLLFSGGIPVNIALCARDLSTSNKYKQIRKYTKVALSVATYWYLIHLIVLFIASCIIIIHFSVYSNGEHIGYFIFSILCIFIFSYNDIITLRALFQLSHPVLHENKNRRSTSVTDKALMHQIFNPQAFYYTAYPIRGTKTECDMGCKIEDMIIHALDDSQHGINKTEEVYLDGLNPDIKTAKHEVSHCSMPSYMTNDTAHFIALNRNHHNDCTQTNDLKVHLPSTPLEHSNKMNGFVEVIASNGEEMSPKNSDDDDDIHSTQIDKIMVHKTDHGITPISPSDSQIAAYDFVTKASDHMDSDSANTENKRNICSDEKIMQHIWNNPSVKTATSPHSVDKTPRSRNVDNTRNQNTNLFTLYSNDEMDAVPAQDTNTASKIPTRKRTNSTPIIQVTSPRNKSKPKLHAVSKSAMSGGAIQISKTTPNTPNANYLSVNAALQSYSNKNGKVTNRHSETLTLSDPSSKFSYYRDVRIQSEILPSQIHEIQSQLPANAESAMFKMADSKTGTQQSVVLVKCPLSESQNMPVNKPTMSPANSSLLCNDQMMENIANDLTHTQQETVDETNKYWFKNFIYHMDEFFSAKERMDDGLIIDYDEEESLSLDV